MLVLKYLILALSLLHIVACGNDRLSDRGKHIDAEDPPPAGLNPPQISMSIPFIITPIIEKTTETEVVVFSDVSPIVEAKCVICHSSAPNQFNPIDLRKFPFEVNGTSDQKTIVQMIVNALKGKTILMPPAGPLSDEEIKLFESWFNDGLLTEQPKPGEKTTKISFVYTIAGEEKKILIDPINGTYSGNINIKIDPPKSGNRE